MLSKKPKTYFFFLVMHCTKHSNAIFLIIDGRCYYLLLLCRI